MPEVPAVPTPSASFRFCPGCGHGPADRPDPQAFSCAACGFHYHFNPVVAAGVVVEAQDGRILLVRRSKEPSRRLLAFPGGFVDFAETAEAAARREAHEETGVELEALSFLGSWPNLYEWKGITYAIVDLYFTGHLCAGSAATALHEVEEVVWLRPEAVDPASLAFPTTRAALARYRETRRVVYGRVGR